MLIVLGCFTVSLVSRGDVAVAEFPGTGDFSYAVNFMTDLDQKRSGLPNDGSMYCAPTAAMNLITYAANFGFPDLMPGPGVWEGVPRHDEMTVYLFFLGEFMQTDPDEGTKGGFFQGFKDWVAGSSMNVVRFARNDDFWPVVDTGAFLAVCGAVVEFCYGRYEFTPGLADAPWLKERKSGHCVTLQRAVASNGAMTGPRDIRYRNPGSPDDGDLSSNSDFSSVQPETAENIFAFYGDTPKIFVVTSLNNPPPDDDRYRVIDSVTALYPPAGLSYTEVEVNAQFANGALGFVQNQQPVPYTIELLNANIADIAMESLVSVAPHPELHSALAIATAERGQKFLVQMPHARARPMALLDLPAGACFLVPGYGHAMFAISDTDIVRLKVRHQEADRGETVPLPGAAARVPIEAAAYNHETGELLLVSGAGGELFILDGATLGLAASLRIDASFRRHGIRSLVAWGAERRRLIAAFDNGWVAEAEYASPARTQERASSALGFKRLHLPGAMDPLSVDIDDGGRLYLADGRSGLLEFTEDSRRGWQPAARPLYAAFDLAGRKFAVFRSRTNHRPEIHDTDEWNNIDPAELVPLGPDIAD